MLPQKKEKITPDEYLKFEKNSEFKHEYFDGEIFAMVGASLNHNRISFNLSRELGNQLKNSSCEGFSGDMRVKVKEIEKYTYPDIVVACDKIELEENGVDTLLNPIVIMEILSDSTEAYDRGLKFEHYQLIGSLQEYILISQHSCTVVRYLRNQDDSWNYKKHTDMNKILKLESIKCELSLSEIYHRVEFKKL